MRKANRYLFFKRRLLPDCRRGKVMPAFRYLQGKVKLAVVVKRIAAGIERTLGISSKADAAQCEGDSNKETRK